MIKLEYKAYNSKYPVFFHDEKRLLETAVNNETEIIHIGSTSIHGLGGKDVIDIMIASVDSELKKIKDKLLTLDYDYNHELSFGERYFFSKEKEKNYNQIRVHLHLTAKNSDAHKKAVLFKNHLLNNKDLALEYENLKKNIIEETKGDYTKYRELKNKYIDKIFKSTYSN